MDDQITNSKPYKITHLKLNPTKKKKKKSLALMFQLYSTLVYYVI